MDPIERAEFEALVDRVRRLEAQMARAEAQPVCTRCGAPLAGTERYCVACGASTGLAPPPAPAPPTPVSFVPVPARPELAVEPASHPARQAPRRDLESTLGQRLAPRLGALLVFLAALFFLGLGIERGWIGPLVQLGLATVVGVGLGIVALVLSGRRYGSYPQLLAGTGASILYATAFVAHALPYYARETGLSELGSGVLMALVALATVGAALWKDARVLVGLGYALGFLTAGAGWGVFPALTLAYVAILGTSLAAVVAWRGWLLEALVGTLATGGLLLSLAWLRPEGGWAALAMVAPVAAFLALTLRRKEGEDATLKAVVGVLTLTWGACVSLAPLPHQATPEGLALLGWVALAGGLAWAARGTVRDAYGVAALVGFLVAVPMAWTSVPQAGLWTTCTYAAAALALALVSRGVGMWNAAMTLAAAAALHAVFLDHLLRTDGLGGATGAPLGAWPAWLTLAAIVPGFAALVLRAPTPERQVVPFAAASGFVAVWGLALFFEPFLLTMFFLLFAGGLAVVARSAPPSLGDAARIGSMALAVLAAAKTGILDTHIVSPAMPLWAAGIETALVTAVLLAIHHVRARRPLSRDLAMASGVVLVGGSAAALASFAFAYFAGPWISVTMGALGVAYLVAGFAMREQAVYRYTGFGVLGFTLFRVFTVDLGETDLAVRAGIFAILGAILLGVGYAYARMNRTQEPKT